MITLPPFKSSKTVVSFLQLLTLNRTLLTMLEVLTNGHNMPKRTFCNTSLNDILIYIIKVTVCVCVCVCVSREVNVKTFIHFFSNIVKTSGLSRP